MSASDIQLQAQARLNEPRLDRSICFIDKVFLKRFPVGEPLRGVELFNLLLIKDLVATGYAVTVVALKSWRKPIEDVLGARMPEVLHPPDLKQPVLSGIAGVLRLASRHYETLLIGNAGDSLIPVLRLAKTCNLADQQVVIAHRDPSAQFARACANQRGWIVAVNEPIAHSFKRAGCADVVVDYGIMNADKYVPATNRSQDESVVHFGVVGALDNPWKGADTAIAAFRQLPAEWQERCHLHLASYPHPPDISDRNITAYSWMPATEMPAFLQRLDVLIVPSRDEEIMRETFSQATVQGMLTGLPIIHANLPILTEKFDQGGGVAFRDKQTLCEAISALAGDSERRHAMGATAREIALKRYVWDTQRFITRYIDSSGPPAPLDRRPPEACGAVQRSFGPLDLHVIEPRTTDEAFVNWLKSVPDLMKADRLPDDAEVLSEGRNRIVKLTGPDGEFYAIKSFAQQPIWIDLLNRKRGGKAWRSFQVAQQLFAHGVGTPAPIACVQACQGWRIADSYYVSRYESELSFFRDELIQLYRHEPDCEKLMHLLQVVAREVARLHQVGWSHRDLGNQNIALRRFGDDRWGDVQFIDLNRARMGTAGSAKNRAFDCSRISLPSDFLRVFCCMYGGDRPLPKSFHRHERRYRRRFAWHTKSRVWRHPIRTARRRRLPQDPKTTYPAWKELWIWDKRSGQAIVVMDRRERKRHYSWLNAFRIARATVRLLPAVQRNYKAEIANAFSAPVDLNNRAGMTVHPDPVHWDCEFTYLKQLCEQPDGKYVPIPILVRFYHHETESDWRFIQKCIAQLQEAGFPVSIALVQDRKAVTNSASWAQFVDQVLEPLIGQVEWVEVGHAINRVKWGVWSLDEYSLLMEPLKKYQRRIKIMGPSVIDFEYQYVAGALDQLRGQIQFDALSHHLYVDRRGAPENRQGQYALVEKCALAKSIARASSVCGSRLIISEVNWPIADTGVYSPVGAPYTSPGIRTGDPSVNELEYAAYMLRYYVLAITSGFVERVYWWRLAAYGYGLVNDYDPHDWRPRPAYHFLRFWLQCAAQSRFTKRLAMSEGAHAFVFEKADGHRWMMAYAHPHPITFIPSFSFREVRDAWGRAMSSVEDAIQLTGQPIYFIDVDGIN